MKSNFSPKRMIANVQVIRSIDAEVYQPCAVGAGNSNDGNMARTAFDNAEIFAEICHVNVDLIKGICTIYTVLACGYDIDSKKFKIFCDKMLDLFFNEDPEVGATSAQRTLHKILVHGPAIIDAIDILLGLLSEEPAKANNKVI
jgi:hypothetical protein